MTDIQRLIDQVNHNFFDSVSQLSYLVKIPSVSWDGYDQTHVEHSADAVRSLFESLNFFNSIEVDAVVDEAGRPGRPAVLGIREATPGYPTVMLYAHHDVQPWGDKSEWGSDPFQPHLKNGRLYGRGTSDDKAGIIVHYAAIRALQQICENSVHIGVVLYIEGEEEWGSRSFRNFLKKHASKMHSDVIIVADSDNWDTKTPALTTSLRGNVTFTLQVDTLEHASHSGMYGGAAPDAPMAAIKLLSTLWDSNGSVAVAGMRSHSSALPEYGEQQFREDAGILSGVSPIGSGNILERIWNKPAITVTGMGITNIQDASNTLIPRVQVKVSARVAPGQSAEEAFEFLKKHLSDNAPFGSQLSFTDIDLGEPFLVDTSSEATHLMTEAMSLAWKKDAVMSGIGGSIPFISDFLAQFPEADILITGVEDPQTRAHSPNESQDLGVLKKAILSESVFFLKLQERFGSEEAK